MENIFCHDDCQKCDLCTKYMHMQHSPFVFLDPFLMPVSIFKADFRVLIIQPPPPTPPPAAAMGLTLLLKAGLQ